MVGSEDTFLLQQGEDSPVLLAEVLGHQLLDVLVDHGPGGHFGLGVVNDGNGISTVKIITNPVRQQYYVVSRMIK